MKLAQTLMLAVMPSSRKLRVIDGDTVVLQHTDAAEPFRARLHDVDCPERSTVHGHIATRAMKALLNNQAITIQTKGKGKYGRTLVVIHTPQGNVNRRLATSGACKWRPQHLR